MEDKSDSRKVQYFASLAVAVAAMTCGLSIYWTTPMLPKFHDNSTGIEISDGQISWVASLSSTGVMVGSLLVSFISDRYGRKPAILGSALPIAIGTIIVIFAKKPWMLYIVRLLWGCGTGIFLTVSSIYLVEISDKNIRGLLTVGSRFSFNFGSFLIMAIGPFLEYQTINNMLMVLPVAYFSVCWWIPESPYYLLRAGKVDDARKELQLLRAYKDVEVLEDKLCEMRTDVKKEMRHSGTTKELVTGKQYRKAIFVAVGVKMTQIMSGSVPILQYLGRIMQDTKTNIQVSTALIIFGAVRFAVGILASFIVDRIGRRPLLMFSFSGVCVIFAFVGAFLYCQEVVGVDLDPSNPLRFITLAGIIGANIISTLGYDSLVFVIAAEVFPINIKSIAMTCLNIFGGFVTFISVKGFQNMKELTGLYGVFWFFATSALVGALFTFFVVPETKGKSLSEIQRKLQGAYYDDDEAAQNLNKVISTDNEKQIESKELKDMAKVKV